jgi:hypothetical protein
VIDLGIFLNFSISINVSENNKSLRNIIKVKISNEYKSQSK